MSNQKQSAITELANSDENIIALWLYGSRVKGNARDDSDYDLAVLYKEAELDPLTRRTRPECLALDWEKTLSLPTGSLSVVDLEIAPIPLAMGVLTTGQQLLSRQTSRELFVTQRIMSKWELDYQYHYQHYG